MTKRGINSGKEIELNFTLQTSEEIKEYINTYKAKIDYDKNVFEEITPNSFTVCNSWTNLEYNSKTGEFVVINLKDINTTQDVIKLKLKVRNNIENIEKTNITISNMQTANWKTKEDITVCTIDEKQEQNILLIINKQENTNGLLNQNTNTNKNENQNQNHKQEQGNIVQINPIDNLQTSEKSGIIPKLGQSNGTLISILLAVSIIVMITSFIKMKRINHKLFTILFAMLVSAALLSNTVVKASTIKGDINKDGKINIADIEILEKKLINLTTIDDTNVADMNEDKKISIVDLSILIETVINADNKTQDNTNNEDTKQEEENKDDQDTENESDDNSQNLGNSDTDKEDDSNTQQQEKEDNDDNSNTQEEEKDNNENDEDNDDEKNDEDDDTNEEENKEEDNSKPSEEEDGKEEDNQQPIEQTNTKTALEAVNEMKIGWNLGNTLDSCNYKKKYIGEETAISYYETVWGNPQTTKEMIDEIKKAGFEAIRVPVTYYDHIKEDGTIDEKWFQRVEEVVGYVLENDMYCVLDVHHDSGLCEAGSWIVADADKYEENAKNISDLWTQIATRFKDYDYKLVFEGFNEIVDTNKNYNWTTGHQNTLNVYKLNQVFIDTVRKTGGKNRDRFLVVTTFGAVTDEHKLSTFTMPQDEAEDKIILALHDYSNTQAGIDKMLARIKKYCCDKNIPVILDEFGTKSSFGDQTKRAEVAKYYVESAKKIGVTCFWWDNGGDYMIFNRRNLNWAYPDIKDALINAAK